MTEHAEIAIGESRTVLPSRHFVDGTLTLMVCRPLSSSSVAFAGPRIT